MKKCDEQVINRDEQARGVGMEEKLTAENTEGKMRFCSKWKSAESSGRVLDQMGFLNHQ
jgi:hypothetical protein